MSKIIKKRDLDSIIENTLKENGFILENKKNKPDFLDLDGDGDKKESMKKAAKDKKNMEEEELCEGDDCGGDLIEDSTKELAEDVNKTTNNKLLSEEMDKFKKLINHRI